ncbi:MAG: hypothetical protein KDA99_02250, partial [Planctomycetales bacterium]|nr:hypothetical protein [Planctomycetales bacterium]
ETVLHRMQKGDTLAWQIVSEEDTNDDQEQVWTFTQTSVAHRGDFVWKVAEGTKAEGHYSLSANARLTISLGQNGHTKSYGCTIVDEGDGSKLVVTVPKAPVDGETEPSSVEFELQLLESDEVADDSSE